MASYEGSALLTNTFRDPDILASEASSQPLDRHALMSHRPSAPALPIPARRAVLRTIRPAPCRSSRRPSAARNTGPPVRSPTARSIARAVRGASGMVTTLPP
jgi:hypothetical protein